MNKLMPLVPAGASRRLGPDFPGDVLSFEAKVVKRYHEAGEVRVELKNSKKRTTVEEIAPGALRMQLPIAIPGLRHVNMYCFPDADGATVVDPGLPDAATWTVIKQRLRDADLEVRHVHTVLVSIRIPIISEVRRAFTPKRVRASSCTKTSACSANARATHTSKSRSRIYARHARWSTTRRLRRPSAWRAASASHGAAMLRRPAIAIARNGSAFVRRRRAAWCRRSRTWSAKAMS
jgi:hypothetical protein